VTRLPLLFACLTLAAALPGCLGGDRAFIREGTADSVTISHQDNVAATLPVAKKHCAQFERVAQLVEANTELATYDCRRP
jgi:hypothetical protein